MLLGHDLTRFAKSYDGLTLAGLALYSGAGVLLPLALYKWVLRSPWWLAIAAVCAAQCVVLGAGHVRLWRRGRRRQAVMLVCIGNWATFLFATFVLPDLLPVYVLAALLPVVIAAGPYGGWLPGATFALITAGYAVCVLALAALARFQNISHLSAHMPRWITSALLIPLVVLMAFFVVVIVWNNAAKLRTSRARLVTVADEERRRLERDLHDGAQQQLVALAVLIQLARRTENGRSEPLLTEATGLLETAIAEIRRLAHGIYPPLLVGGGLNEALPAVAAHAPIPVQLDLHGLHRYPAPVEAALYFCCSEALQNAAKHGGPDTTVTITAHADERMLTLTISDTGRGFDPAITGTGLTNMSDRLAAIGGQLVIDSAPGRG
ncbi:MAG: sensor histidine kinase, partial [Mycobacterium sp.]|nr:sensor histidine kinase [Mycobacterium sp.]